MTRKDFLLIADTLKRARRLCETREQERGVERAVGSLADALQSTNPAFDRARFVAVATPSPGEGRIQPYQET